MRKLREFRTSETHLEELGTLGRVTWKRRLVSFLFGLFGSLDLLLAHVQRGEKAEGVPARHFGNNG